MCVRKPVLVWIGDQTDAMAKGQTSQFCSMVRGSQWQNYQAIGGLRIGQMFESTPVIIVGQK